MALCSLSGSAAISQGAARVMVALHPSLSSAFAVDGDAAQGDEAVRRRGNALHEVIGAVSEEGAVALVIDDVHWMDDVSRRLLMSVLQKLNGERLLVVTTSRPRYPFSGSPEMRQLDLAALTPAQVGALVASLGALPPAPWAASFAEDLHASTAGTPLLLLETLQLLMEQHVVTLDGPTWVAHDEPALREVLAAGSALRTRLVRLADAERRALTLLAAAGVSLANDLIVRIATVPDAESNATLESLEHRGLVARTTEGWELAHDAVGELALDIATRDELLDAHARIARAYLEMRPNDAATLFRAGRHFSLAAESTSVQRAFVRWVALLRRDGEARTPRALAEEFAGAETDADTRSRLVRALPLHLQLPRRRMIGALAASMLAAAMLVGFRVYAPAAPPPPEAMLLAIYADPGKDTVRISIDIRHEDLDRRSIIQLDGGKRVSVPVPPTHNLLKSAISPDGKTWAFTRAYPDSGSLDVGVMDTRTGRTQRITAAPRSDDHLPSWSPDGRYLVISTGRYNRSNLDDLAIIDAQSRVVRQLTSGDDTDSSPAWSPTGPRIAFVRRSWSQSDRLCTIAFDGSSLACFADSAYETFDLLGWFDHEHLVILARPRSNDTGAEVAMVNVRNHEIRPLQSSLQARLGQLDPNGRWVLCQCRVNTTAVWRWFIFPVDRPSLYREVTRDALGQESFSLTWVATSTRKQDAASLHIDVPPAGIQSGLGALLGATALDRSNKVVPVAPLRWTSLDTAKAIVDASTGVVTAKDTGTARIHVSAGGWIVADTSVRIVPAAFHGLLTERWENGLAQNFIPFGEPQPTIVTDARLGHAMFHNGDRDFPSGVYSRQAFEGGSGGIGFEVVASAKIDSLHWQSLGLSIFPDPPRAMLDEWDHRIGAIGWGDSGPSCDAAIPYGEGPAGLSLVAFGTGEATGKTVAPSGMRSGAPFRLRLQLFSDGRCGIAINGRPVAIIGNAARLAPRYRVRAMGQSEWTRILVGKLDVWQGVKRDVDWDSFRP